MTQPNANIFAPSLDLIAALAHETVEALPAPWREPARAVVLRIEDFPSDEVLEEMDLNDAFELTGLYEGVPMTEKSVSEPAPQPDLIWLFRRPILDEWAERGDVTLAELVAHVVVHELAHHFGWSDEDIARVDQWWE